jgi:hypothetical protein
MITDFPCYRQPTGQSCLPTAVYAVLSYNGHPGITLAMVAGWCQLTPQGGAIWDISLDNLKRELDIDDLEDNWDGIVETVEIEEYPVIVTISHPDIPTSRTGDHAVVIVGIVEVSGEETVLYMDPIRENIEQMSSTIFQKWWDAPGGRAFVIRG